MKLINKIKDLINDDENPRVKERLLIILYLLTLEFVLVAVVWALAVANPEIIIYLIIAEIIITIIAELSIRKKR